MRWQTADPLGFEDGLNLYSYVHNNPFFYRDSDGRFAFAFAFAIPIIEIAFGGAIEAVVFPSLAKVAITAIVAVGAYQAGQYIGGKVNDDQMHMENQEAEESLKRKDGKTKFPENPDDLLPELPRDKDGMIQTADNLRIRPEKHPFKENDVYNPRHHDTHYHVETRRDPTGSWKKNQNIEISKPPNYYEGMGTGFLPGEYYPGI